MKVRQILVGTVLCSTLTLAAAGPSEAASSVGSKMAAWASQAAEAVKHGVQRAASAVEHGAQVAGHAVNDTAHKLGLPAGPASGAGVRREP